MTAMTCPSCGKVFDCTNGPHDRHACYACWYGEENRRADERFRPLKEAMERELEIECHVWQSGGMIFTLEIQLAGGKYVLMSDWDWDGADGGASFGVYDENGEQIAWRENATIPYEPENAEAIAKWAGPEILKGAAEWH